MPFVSRRHLPFVLPFQLPLGAKPVFPRRSTVAAASLPIGISKFGNLAVGGSARLIVDLQRFGGNFPWFIVEQFGCVHGASSVRNPKASASRATVRSSTTMRHAVT